MGYAGISDLGSFCEQSPSVITLEPVNPEPGTDQFRCKAPAIIVSKNLKAVIVYQHPEIYKKGEYYGR